jgi:hypothetical protein
MFLDSVRRHEEKPHGLGRSFPLLVERLEAVTVQDEEARERRSARPGPVGLIRRQVGGEPVGIVVAQRRERQMDQSRPEQQPTNHGGILTREAQRNNNGTRKMPESFDDPSNPASGPGAVLSEPNQPDNPYPDHYTDAEWREVMTSYNSWRRGGFLNGTWLYPYPPVTFQPFPDRPTVFFDYQGRPSLTAMPPPDPGFVRRSLQEMWRLLNYRWPHQQPAPRPTPGGSRLGVTGMAPSSAPPIALASGDTDNS